jgi:adenosine deaminase
MYEHVVRRPEDLAATQRLLAALPKVELHTHLAGNVPEWLFAETAAKHGIALANPTSPYHFEGELGEFLVVYEQVADSFRTAEDLYRASYESLAEEARTSNLRYREVHFSPTINAHLDYADAIAAIAAGMDDAKRDHGVDARIIVAVYRSQGAEVAERLAAEMIAHPPPAVVGLGIEADETLGPIEWFDTTYRMVRDAGYEVTAHAGERADLAEVLYAVETLGCRRIDHGYALATDAAAAARVADAGVHIASTWLSASIHHGAVSDNPIRTLLDEGLDVSLSSDDPGIGRISVNQTLLDALTVLELGDDYLVAQNYAQLEHAWIDEGTRARIRVDIEAALADVAVSD